MHVFHIKGFSGIAMFLLALISGILLVFALPSAFLMVIWNSIVFEGMNGPEISLYQGFLLWGMFLVCIKLIFQPEIRFQLMRGGSGEHGKANQPIERKRNGK